MKRELRHEPFGLYEGESRDPKAGEYDWGTMDFIQKWMIKHNIPENAVLTYDGCGSHNLAFEWWEEVPEVLDTLRKDTEDTFSMEYPPC